MIYDAEFRISYLSLTTPVHIIPSDNLCVTENSDVPVALTSLTGMELISEDWGPSTPVEEREERRETREKKGDREREEEMREERKREGRGDEGREKERGKRR